MFILAISLYLLINGDLTRSTFWFFAACQFLGALAYLKLGYGGLWRGQEVSKAL